MSHTVSNTGVSVKRKRELTHPCKTLWLVVARIHYIVKTL